MLSMNFERPSLNATRLRITAVLLVLQPASMTQTIVLHLLDVCQVLQFLVVSALWYVSFLSPLLKRCLIDFSIFRRTNVNVFLLRPLGIPTTRCRWPRTLLLIHLRLPPRIFLLFLTEPLNRLWLPLLPYVFLAYYSSFTQSLIFLDLCISS